MSQIFTRLISSFILGSLMLCATVGCLPTKANRINQYPDQPSVLQQRLENSKSDDVIIIAHRACWREAQENSIKAIDACIRSGIDMIEIDIRQTKDGHLVLMHDKTVDRTTDGVGAVKKMTLEQIRALRLKAHDGGKDASITNESVPTLREALLVAKGKIFINLDIKANLYDKALKLLEETGMTGQILMKMVALPKDKKLRNANFLGYTAFMPIIRQCRKGKKGICSPDLSEVLPGYFDLDPVAYEIVFQDEDYLLDGVALIKSDNARLWVNTLREDHAAGHTGAKAIKNPDAHWGYLIGLGMNMIQTDYPIELIEYLRSKDLHQ